MFSTVVMYLQLCMEKSREKSQFHIQNLRTGGAISEKWYQYP